MRQMGYELLVKFDSRIPTASYFIPWFSAYVKPKNSVCHVSDALLASVNLASSNLSIGWG